MQSISEQKGSAAGEDSASQEDLMKNVFDRQVEYQTQELLLSPLFASNNSSPQLPPAVAAQPVGNNQTSNSTANSNGSNGAVATNGSSVGNAGPQPDPALTELYKFIDDPQFGYEDFARRREESDFPTFRVQDYSWDDHGFSLVNRLYSDIGNLLDEKFKICYNLTYYT